ncbi:MAG: hypothetical protein ACXVBW_10320, partial [Bdellovibrionota bacterium]
MKTLAALMQIPDRISRFRELCDLYSDFVRAENIRVRPYESEELPEFSSLSLDRQDNAIASITADLEDFESMRAEGHRLRDSSKLLWRALNRMGLVPQSDVFDKIGEEDIVEVYLIDQRGQNQVFRSLIYLQYCSYTVEQMVALDWRFSAKREEKYTNQITAAVIDIMSGKIQQTFDPGIDAHHVQEVDSPGLNEVMVKIKYLSPVRSKGAAAGGIAVF